MTTQIYEWVKEVKNQYLPQGRLKVLEVGALDINGSARDHFPDAEYLGTDMMEGKGVDVVVNGHDIKLPIFKRNSFDVTICLETFEHDVMFWVTLRNLREVTKEGGYMLISTPTFKFPLHRHPQDFYRFGEDAYRELFFRGWDILDLREVVSKGVNPGIVCIGRKPND